MCQRERARSQYSKTTDKEMRMNSGGLGLPEKSENNTAGGHVQEIPHLHDGNIRGLYIQYLKKVKLRPSLKFQPSRAQPVVSRI